MTETKAAHTPGPFFVRDDGDKYGPAMVRDEHGRELADCTGGLSDGVTLAEMHGNVRLFAAAPELLKELKHLVRYFDQLTAGDVVKAKAAIAAAEGRE